MNFLKINKKNDKSRRIGDTYRADDKAERAGENRRMRREKIDKKAITKADKLGKTAGERDIKKVGSRLGKMKRGPIADLWHIVEALWTGFKSPDIPAETKIAIIGALVYLVSPVDIVPDFLLPGGLLDDAAVIAFVYAQCKDLITETIPKISEQVKNGIRGIGDAASEQIQRVTEDTVSATVGKQFQRYCTRFFFNSLLKLTLFAASMLILAVSKPAWTPGIIAASVLLVIVSLWFALSAVTSCIACFKFLNNFFPALKQIRTREAQNTLVNSRYKKLRLPEVFAEAVYTAIAEDVSGKSAAKKSLYAFFFRAWNEGKLPAWIPRKRAMTEHVWNALKTRIAVFIGSVSGYLVVYNSLVRNLILPAVTDYTLPELLAYPFVYVWNFLH